jgi:uracil-DNA glycosylase
MKHLIVDADWQTVLSPYFAKDYFKNIIAQIEKDKKEGKTIYPPEELIFTAFNTTPLSKIKVVILGQDPYHNEGQAHGLAFSVAGNTKPPPSLVNIFKELKNDLDIDIPNHGNLTNWAHQGVFLLNTYLTVVAHTPLSHSKIGWEQFTNDVIKLISASCNNVVFILWGGNARKKKILIDNTKHLILKSAHPSPLSAHNGFWGNHHFSRANEWLDDKRIAKVSWFL